ncbi:helix-turn-helix transcriptional regulator [Paracoccus sp. PS-1]|uniref:helix-turn-helix domain-containing protein n=1 Tax=Paracoccus sp. PS1 TaxID=2963938 RepID=UPI0027E4E690|nr:helix-turn-helix transcriptional regulator [Paracoccus sp. PS1]MDQ7262236.1 helix-turn-helix transcriptional regulator [Paracoccus sp. PS1]
MAGIMGYNYPIRQAHIYSMGQVIREGYICPMDMTFRDALKHAMAVNGIKSLRSVATATGVSYHILKNMNQGKSERPNAEAATKIADYFEASLTDFYAGRVAPRSGKDMSVMDDVAKIKNIMQDLRPESRARVQAFAEALRQTDEGSQQNE